MAEPIKWTEYICKGNLSDLGIITASVDLKKDTPWDFSSNYVTGNEYRLYYNQNYGNEPIYVYLKDSFVIENRLQIASKIKIAGNNSRSYYYSIRYNKLNGYFFIIPFNILVKVDTISVACFF